MKTNKKPIVSKTKKTGGFTLIELMVVLVILAMMAAMLVPSLIGYISKAKRDKLQNECRSCVMAAQTISTAEFGLSGEYAVIDPTEVLEMADLKDSKSKVSEIERVLNSAKIKHLKYVNKHGDAVEYEINDTFGATFTFSDGEVVLGSGIFFKKGDTNTPYTTIEGAYNKALIVNDKIANISRIDSTAPVGGYIDLVNAALGDKLGGMNVQSWAIIKESGFLVYWFTDVDISGLPENSYVRVVRYNTNLKTYTAGYMKVVKSKEGDYMVLNGTTNQGLWREYKGAASQNNNTKKDYEKTVGDFFNEMPATVDKL